MNEQITYATMLEMPVSTASVTIKPSKKKKRRRGQTDDQVKHQLIEKINAEQTLAPELLLQEQGSEIESPSALELLKEENEFDEQTISVKPIKKQKGFGKFKVSVISVQIMVVGLLIATIFLTSAFNQNSGINVFFRSVFGINQANSVDARTYLDFAPVINLDERSYVLEDGVITVSSTGSVYSACDGVISKLEKDSNGKFTVEIEHGKNFKSVLTGLDFVYGEVGGAIFSNLPVGYQSESGATMCFLGQDGAIISGYQIVDNSVVWAV